MTAMKNRLMKLYVAGQITIAELDKAVAKGWIDEAEKAEIIAAKPV